MSLRAILISCRFFVPTAKAGTHLLKRKRDAKCTGKTVPLFRKNLDFEPNFADVARKVTIRQAMLNIYAYWARWAHPLGYLANILASGVAAVLASPTDSRQGSPVRRGHSLSPALPPQL
jgi:hypothetical protein